MAHIVEIHEEVYEFLTGLNDDLRDSLRFSLRRTNRDGRLEEGYWFYGNEKYLAVSFWSGNDWKNRTPNIIFSITPNGETYLEFNVSDSKIKRNFVEQFLLSKIAELKPSGQRYYKKYPPNNYIESLRNFLATDKKIIDATLEEHQNFFSSENDQDRISFIDPLDFDRAREKVEHYRDSLREETFPEANTAIKQIHIRGYGPIKDTGLFNIPPKTQWIFLTGENGTGKTNLLRAIALALTNTRLTKEAAKENPEFGIHAELFNNKKQTAIIDRDLNREVDPKRLWVSGFAAYGASRLITNNNGLATVDLNRSRRKADLVYNLFNTDGVLLDLLYKQNVWSARKRNKKVIEERLNGIREVLYDIIPNLHKVIFPAPGEPPVTRYIEEDKNEEPYPNEITFDKLASGVKSMVAMFGDMLCRLFDQQPNKSDPSELTGIVMIDEIDIHLHPKLQKKLVEELTKTFRNIQFIATTHSPIPLLGAPKNSCFFKVVRTIDHGVEARNLSDIDVFHLLPNSILTSDLFDMNSIFERVGESSESIRTEDDFKEIKINDDVKEELKQIANKIKEG